LCLLRKTGGVYLYFILKKNFSKNRFDTVYLTSLEHTENINGENEETAGRAICKHSYSISIQMSRALDFSGCKQAEALCFHFLIFTRMLARKNGINLKV